MILGIGKEGPMEVQSRRHYYCTVAMIPGTGKEGPMKVQSRSHYYSSYDPRYW
jgi:hypothetical protein